MKVKLIIQNDSETKDFVLGVGETLTLGRSGNCTVPVLDDRLSSRHCRLNLTVNRLEIIDLDSKNGTYLNGIRIEQSEIFLGDKIKIGKTSVFIEHSGADTEALRTLAFGGETRDRIKYELKADFTGARIANQVAGSSFGMGLSPEVSQNLEVQTRRETQINNKVSKDEIRDKNNSLTRLARFIDIGGMIFVLLLPTFYLSKIMPQDISENDQNKFILMLETLIFILYYFGNYKILKYTLGEKISGIEKLYQNQ